MYTFPGKTTRCLRCFSHKKKKRRQPHRSALPRGFVCLPGTPAPPSKGMDTGLFQTTTNRGGKAKSPPPAAEFLKIRGQKAPPERPERTTTPPVAPGGGFARHHFDRRRSHRLRPGRSRENGRTEQAIRHTTGQRLRPRPTPPPAKKTVLKQSASGRSVASRIACE